MSRRFARIVLNEYMDKLRATWTYVDAINEYNHATGKYTIQNECNRVLKASIWNGDGLSFGNILPKPLPNGDRAFGSGNWKTDDSGKKVPYFDFHFIERHDNYEGFLVTHSLHLDGTGSVWLGEANNSARDDLSGNNAWAAWLARFELVGEKDKSVTETELICKYCGDPIEKNPYPQEKILNYWNHIRDHRGRLPWACEWDMQTQYAEPV